MVAADAPGRAVATWALVAAFPMELGAALVPELVTSTLSQSCIAIVAGPAWERWSRAWSADSGCRRQLLYVNRVCVCEARHEWLQLGIPQRTRLIYKCDMSRDLWELRAWLAGSSGKFWRGPSAYRECANVIRKEPNSFEAGNALFMVKRAQDVGRTQDEGHNCFGWVEIGAKESEEAVSSLHFPKVRP